MPKRRLLIAISLLILIMGMTAGCEKKEQPSSSNVSSGTQTDTDSKTNDLAKAMAEIKGLPGYSCEMIMSADAQNVSSKLWASGSQWRMEMEVDGIKNIMLINGKGEIWNYMPTENMAMKMAAPPEATLPTDWAESEDKPQVTGQEQVDGYKCLVVTYPNDKDTKCWIMKDRGLPVKIESIVDGQKTVIQYKNYNINKQPDDLFEVPAGTQVLSIPGAS